METIKCTFYRPEQVNVKAFQQITDKLENDYGFCIRKEVSPESVRGYAEALLDLAKPLKKNPGMYFLGLDEPENMPSDARVEYFYRPTYLGTAIIMQMILADEAFLSDAGRKEVFQGLLLGCTGRGFAGHGYDDLKGMIYAMSIFAAAGADEFNRKYPQLCTKFTDTYNKCLQELKQRLRTGTVQNAWGEDYTADAEKVIRLNEGKS